jgi:hypothetical protein
MADRLRRAAGAVDDLARGRRNGGRHAYRACQADRAALWRMRRPKRSKLARCARLLIGRYVR